MLLKKIKTLRVMVDGRPRVCTECEVIEGVLLKNQGVKNIYGYLPVDLKRVKKPQIQQYGLTDCGYLRFRETQEVFNLEEGDVLVIRGRSRGKGFQGVMGRWGFAGLTKRGASWKSRSGGSIGSINGSGGVAKGKKMPGRMGYNNVTSSHVLYKWVGSRILLYGTVQGSVNGLIFVRNVVKN